MGSCTGATYGNDGEHTKGGVDYDRRNLIRGGSVFGYRSEETIFMHLNYNKTYV